MKEYLKACEISNFGCKMLYNANNISLESLKNLCTFALGRET